MQTPTIIYQSILKNKAISAVEWNSFTTQLKENFLQAKSYSAADKSQIQNHQVDEHIGMLKSNLGELQIAYEQVSKGGQKMIETPDMLTLPE